MGESLNIKNVVGLTEVKAFYPSLDFSYTVGAVEMLFIPLMSI